MNRFQSTIVFTLLMALAFAGNFLSSCSDKSMEGKIVFTRSAGNQNNSINIIPDSLSTSFHSQIAAFSPGNPKESLKILTGDFYSARSPRISYDGKFMLFTGQKKRTDFWQIWEMDLDHLTTRQVLSCENDCTDPVYIPGGRLIFSKFTLNDSLKAGHSLYVCNIDGSNQRRITFNPSAYFGSNILNDGRVLTLGSQVYPVKGGSKFMILRPDGTKAEVFYSGLEGNKISGPGWETDDGEIVFVESDAGSDNSDLVSISYNRPLHSRQNLTSGIMGDFLSVYPLQSGKLLVSYRKSESGHFALYEFDQNKKILGNEIFNDPDNDILEAVLIGQHDRPKKLPSEVDMGVKTGLLLCQDINVMDNSFKNSTTKSSRIAIVGLDSILGYVDVESDGSFYLKVLADKPFMIQALDESGNVMRSQCGWIWLRPNERRGCVGCHEDPEMVPSNLVPLAVKKSPVIIPMHINKIVEKKVSLE